MKVKHVFCLVEYSLFMRYLCRRELLTGIDFCFEQEINAMAEIRIFSSFLSKIFSQF